LHRLERQGLLRVRRRQREAVDVPVSAAAAARALKAQPPEAREARERELNRAPAEAGLHTQERDAWKHPAAVVVCAPGEQNQHFELPVGDAIAEMLQNMGHLKNGHAVDPTRADGQPD
jgi:hypothetical protein